MEAPQAEPSSSTASPPQLRDPSRDAKTELLTDPPSLVSGTANAPRTSTQHTLTCRAPAPACVSPTAAVHIRLQTLCFSAFLLICFRRANRGCQPTCKASAVSHCLRHAGLAALCNHHLCFGRRRKRQDGAGAIRCSGRDDSIVLSRCASFSAASARDSPARDCLLCSSKNRAQNNASQMKV
jgi:hypothetical protein